ncbi:MAG: exodeoxyribonuclease VII small subunit [Alphaproteobacteria bacterium]|nr:exodeoxyribonuclease VII small subunit [Alphaproteobacteria bacterium]
MTASAKQPANADGISELSFEDAMLELEKIVRNLEDGKTKLDESVAAYERGAALRRHCENKLKEAQLTVEKISIADDGSLKREPAKLD